MLTDYRLPTDLFHSEHCFVFLIQAMVDKSMSGLTIEAPMSMEELLISAMGHSVKSQHRLAESQRSATIL